MDSELASAALIAGYWQATAVVIGVVVLASGAFSLVSLWAGRHIDAKFDKHAAATDAKFDAMDAKLDRHAAATDAKFDAMDAKLDKTRRRDSRHVREIRCGDGRQVRQARRRDGGAS